MLSIKLTRPVTIAFGTVDVTLPVYSGDAVTFSASVALPREGGRGDTAGGGERRCHEEELVRRNEPHDVAIG